MMNHNDANESYLTPEELQELSNITLRAPDRDLTYADVFAIRSTVNPEATTDEFNVAESDEGEAELVRNLESYPGLKVSNRRVTYAIHKIKFGFALPIEEINASRSWGRPLNVEYVERALRKVQEKINKLAYVGDTKYGVPGILSATGVTSITGTAWTSTTLDLANEVISYVGQLPIVYRQRPYTLVLADAEHKRLMKYFNGSGNVGDRNHLERVRAAIPNLVIAPPEVNLDSGTSLHSGSTVAAGTALLIPREQGLVRMAIAKAPYVLTENHIVDEYVKGAVAARVGVVETPFPTAIGKITGLQ